MSLFSRKYSRRPHRDPQKFFFPYKHVIGRNSDHEWLRMANALILCDLVWKVKKSHAANREGRFTVIRSWLNLPTGGYGHVICMSVYRLPRNGGNYFITAPIKHCWSKSIVTITTLRNSLMPYYCLFSRDLHILDLWWRSPLCSLFVVDFTPCVHYFYVPWLIMTSQWFTTLLGMPHCGTTMGNDIARDIHCDVTMDNDIAMCT